MAGVAGPSEPPLPLERVVVQYVYNCGPHHRQDHPTCTCICTYYPGPLAFLDPDKCQNKTAAGKPHSLYIKVSGYTSSTVIAQS